MQELIAQVRREFTARGHAFFAETAPPRRVAVRPYRTVLLVRAAFAGGNHQAVVKPLPASGPSSRVERLVALHSRICALSPPFARSVPLILGHDAASRWIAMNYVEGTTLLKLLRRAACFAGWGEHRCEAALRQVGRALAALHRLDARAVGLDQPARANASYLPGFEALWHDPLLALHLPGDFASPARLYERLGESFPARPGRCVLLNDSQPKNVLVSCNGAVRLIDLDFETSSPALGVGHFLASLDRLGARYLPLLPASRVARWKCAFASAYLEQASPTAAADLLFFYPWALLQTFQRHRRHWPRLGRYLAWYYGRQLRRFLTRLERLPADLDAAAVAQLFESRMPRNASPLSEPRTAALLAR
jgi:hypothetical protein